MDYESQLKPHGIQSTMWKILRSAYLSAMCHTSGRSAEAMSPEEQNAALDPLLPQIEADMAMLTEVVERARHEAIERVQHGLHRTESLDHEMVDEAIHYSSEWKVDDEPG